jgi:hypothetical protein
MSNFMEEELWLSPEMNLNYDQVRVQIPFALNVKRLTEALKEAGFYVQNEHGEATSQGWGKGYDREGYYPYWVYEDNGAWFFAFPPEDYEQTGPDRLTAYSGPEAQSELDRWWPYLEAARL